jgi:hypothetical protein
MGRSYTRVASNTADQEWLLVPASAAGQAMDRNCARHPTRRLRQRYRRRNRCLNDLPRPAYSYGFRRTGRWATFRLRPLDVSDGIWFGLLNASAVVQLKICDPGCIQPRAPAANALVPSAARLPCAGKPGSLPRRVPRTLLALSPRNRPIATMLPLPSRTASPPADAEADRRPRSIAGRSA